MRRSCKLLSGACVNILALTLLAACDGGSDGANTSPAVTEQSPDNPTTSPSKTEDGGGACNSDKETCDASTPPAHICGDGVVDKGEQCDDGNHIAGDGCDANCKREPGCGDGIVNFAEECDDGNTVDDDACSNACLKNECGNGRVDVNEECDDGNKADADAGPPSGIGTCSDKCLWERCRNGVLDPGEECDDGNDRDDDGCSNRCKIEICGNGKKEDKEECDDGNTVDTDACSNKCTENKCGNGRLDPGEECDGDLNCDDKCKKKPDLCKACEEKYCRTDYPAPGTGIDWYKGCVLGMPPYVMVLDMTMPPAGGTTNRLYTPEEFIQKCMGVVNCVRKTMCLAADDLGAISNHCYCGSASLDACFMTGPVGGACDDEVVAAGEVTKTDYTDLSLRISDFAYPLGWANYLVNCDRDRCSSVCTPWLPPIPPVCGNGMAEMPEDCDDGNTVNGDGCSSTCMTEKK